MPGAVGVRMSLPDRPVVVIVGDGSSLYAIQALWSAAEYDGGVLPLVQRGRLLARAGTRLSAEQIDDHSGLIRALDEVLPALADRSEPLLLEVAVSPGTTFHPDLRGRVQSRVGGKAS
jgi:benzoylformate decarboxylase